MIVPDERAARPDDAAPRTPGCAGWVSSRTVSRLPQAPGVDAHDRVVVTGWPPLHRRRCRRTRRRLACPTGIVSTGVVGLRRDDRQRAVLTVGDPHVGRVRRRSPTGPCPTRDRLADRECLLCPGARRRRESRLLTHTAPAPAATPRGAPSSATCLGERRLAGLDDGDGVGSHSRPSARCPRSRASTTTLRQRPASPGPIPATTTRRRSGPLASRPPGRPPARRARLATSSAPLAQRRSGSFASARASTASSVRGSPGRRSLARGGVSLEMAEDDRGVRRPVERRRAGEALEQQAAERVEVRAGVRLFPPDDLGRQ